MIVTNNMIPKEIEKKQARLETEKVKKLRDAELKRIEEENER